MALWGKTDAVANRPNWIDLDNYPVGTELVFVDSVEARQPANKEKGLNQPGWWLFYEYPDSSDNIRYKTECLVAITDASVVGDDEDNDDDDIVLDRTIVILTQPEDAIVADLAAATFTVEAEVTPTEDMTYQWEVSTDGEVWTAVTGATTDELVVVDTADEYVDSNTFRVVVSSDGAVDVTSDVATLTVE